MAERVQKFPVFTVSKNGSILKNIFLNIPLSALGGEIHQETRSEATKLLVGRHPDCQIVLDHPSISRFHLEIRVKLSLQKLFVIDLSSVHGTWVAGQKIESGAPRELLEGEKLRLGASTRVYRLQWVSLNESYEIEKPLMPLTEASEENQAMHQDQHVKKFNKADEAHTADEMPQQLQDDPTRIPVDGEAQSLSGVQSETGLCWVEERVTPSPGIEVESGIDNRSSPRSSLKQGWLQGISLRSSSPSASASNIKDNSEILMVKVVEEEKYLLPEEFVHSSQSGSCLSETELNCGSNDQHCEVVASGKKLNGREKKSPLSDLRNREPGRRRSESARSMRVQLGSESSSKSETSGAGAEAVTKENTDFSCERGKSFYKALFPGSCLEEESFVSDKDQNSVSVVITANKDLENDTFASNKENMKPKVLWDQVANNLTPKDETRSKSDVANRVNGKQTDRIPLQRLPSDLLSNNDYVSAQKATYKKGNSLGSTQKTTSKNSPSRNHRMDQEVHVRGEIIKKWNMVLDTSSLLDEESWKSLKLLEGLRGTGLVIPRTVISELAHLKQPRNRFKKSEAEEVASILQWIEECMAKTRGWIHVQSSEESMPLASTPPYTSHSATDVRNSSIDDAADFVNLPKCGRSMESISPAAKDHVLEYALWLKRINTEGRLVLLTSNIALKIKAMAEGLICETARDFRESLTNPYSRRFLWVDSRPRGATWSCSDAAASLQQNFCHFWPTVKKTGETRRGAKGLKLLLA